MQSKLALAAAFLASTAHAAPQMHWGHFSRTGHFTPTGTAPVASLAPSATSVASAPVGTAPVVSPSLGTAPIASSAPVESTFAPSTTVPAASAGIFFTPTTSIAVQASTGTSTPANGSGGKRGVAYNDASLTTQFTSSLITWAYNWGQTATGLNPSWEFVPMLWSAASGTTADWTTNADAAIASGSTHLLGFNEPDNAGQANMSPDDAATAWKTYMEPYAGKAQLGSPAVTNSGSSGQGLDWLSSFMSSCSDCTIDFVAIHWYDSSGSVDYFKQYVQQASTQTGKPIWITEFGMYGASDSDQANFLNEVMPWLESQDFVARYAYFGVFSDILVDDSGALTAAGTAYNS